MLALLAAPPALAQSAKELAPGQPAGVEAPGQAKPDGMSGRELAPGQLKKAVSEPDTETDVAASDWAPGHRARKTGEPAKIFAPGQRATETGEPASSFAPGQLSKDVDDNSDAGGSDSHADAGGGNGGGNGGGKK